ncbi:hypothetical protein [Methanoculleus sp.]|uniref:hypothetical protein n=1 Tax=Methanoculleus sp. TaxID=90427 RepID=UPI00320DB826
MRLADGQLIVAGVDDSIGLGAFDVVLSYGSDVSVTSVEGLPGFLVADNIRNDEGMTIIAGISADGLTGDVAVASVKTEGTGPITITVRELGNSRGDPIAFTNPAFGGTIPTPGPPSSGSGSAPSASAGTPLPTTTAPTGTPQPTETGTKTVQTAAATTAVEQESPIEPQGTPEGGAGAESTPKAALPVLLALSAVLTVIILKRKG